MTEKTRLANSRGGKTGSAARRSVMTKLTSRTTAATPRAMMNGDPQPYEVPPSVQASTIALSAAASITAPR